jgi:hypothetical protein
VNPGFGGAWEVDLEGLRLPATSFSLPAMTTTTTLGPDPERMRRLQRLSARSRWSGMTPSERSVAMRLVRRGVSVRRPGEGQGKGQGQEDEDGGQAASR